MTPNSLLQGNNFCFLLCTIFTSLLKELQRHRAFVSFQCWKSLHIQLSYCWSTEAVIDCTRPKATLLLNWHKCFNIKKALCKWEFFGLVNHLQNSPIMLHWSYFCCFFSTLWSKNQQKLMEKPSKSSSTICLGEKVHLQGLHCTISLFEGNNWLLKTYEFGPVFAPICIINDSTCTC